MAVNKEKYTAIKEQLAGSGVTMVAVSKLKPVADILELYALGHRDFGENYVQELVDKYGELPKDIRWHFIGHLQTNKVKYIAPFVHLIHSLDSYKLLKEVEKQGLKNNRMINVLLQIHIATEETKFGLSEAELGDIINELRSNPLKNVLINGFMGMASFSENEVQVNNELGHLRSMYHKHQQVPFQNFQLQTLSMGMSDDYLLAIKNDSNMIRIGSLLFGRRD